MAVFTHITKDDLKDFLKNYSFNNLDFIKGINEGIQNTNYKVGIDSNDYILTIYENITDANDINFFLELMMHLSSNNIKCPTPVKNLENKSIGKIKSLISPPNLRYFLSLRLAPRVMERSISSPISKFDLAIISVLNTLLLAIPSVK